MAITTTPLIPVPPMAWAAWLRKEAELDRPVVLSPKAARELAELLSRHVPEAR